MYCRRFLVIVGLKTLLYFLLVPVLAQADSLTADQIIANYVLAIGGSDRIASITTFAEKGQLSGNLTGYGQPYAPPNMAKEKGTFEFYFKAPNLRSYQMNRENHTVVTMRGCDGKVAWYIGADGVRREFKAKPGGEYECKQGYDPMPLGIRAPNVRFQLKGKKKVGDRAAWEIRAQDPKSTSIDTYYFDTETYLLLRWETAGSMILSSQGPAFKIDRLYSDYRDVGGIKLAFMIVQRGENSSLVTTLQEVEVDAPIDDARFQEPQVSGGKNRHVLIDSPSKSPDVKAENALTPSSPATPPPPPTSPSPAMSNNNEALPSTALPETHVAAESTSVVTASFVSSSIAELQQIAPELRGLKADEDAQDLPALLDKIGARTLDLSRKVPNLISHEEIVESRIGAKTTRENFSYLILARRSPTVVTLEEFRVDLKSGAKLETDDAWKPGTPDSSFGWDELARASQRANARATGHPPLSQGFASMWVRFYPSNRSESNFRYLGQQKIDGHHTLVLAFAQKPGSVRLPAEVRFKDKSVPIYYQGFAWVDISDYRIVRLRTDLLSPAGDLPLTQLTAEVKFADTQATGFGTPLWLPREVVVTSQVNGQKFQDKHSYSKYRSFQVRAKLLLNP